MQRQIRSASQAIKAHWYVGRPMPKIEIGSETIEGQMFRTEKVVGEEPGTTITNIQLVDGDVEVWATDAMDPQNGRRVTLCKPSVTMVVSGLDEEAWAQAIADFKEDGVLRETVTAVTDMGLDVWRVNQDVPSSPGLVIHHMVMDGGDVEIFVKPRPGTPAEVVGPCHIRLMAFFFSRVVSTAPIREWMAIQKEIMKSMADDERDERYDRERRRCAARGGDLAGLEADIKERERSRRVSAGEDPTDVADDLNAAELERRLEGGEDEDDVEDDIRERERVRRIAGGENPADVAADLDDEEEPELAAGAVNGAHDLPRAIAPNGTANPEATS